MSKKVNKYTYNVGMLQSTTILNDAFENHPKLKQQEYILTGVAACNFYNLTMFSKQTLTINIRDNKRESTVYRRLLSKGLREKKEVQILKGRSSEILNESVNNVRFDIKGVEKNIRIVSLEKLFIEIEYFKIMPDEEERAVEKLKELINPTKFIKLIKLYKVKKRKISKVALTHFKDITKNDYQLVSGFENVEKSLQNLQENIKPCKIIQTGGIAVKEFTVSERHTKNVDGFINKNERNNVKEILSNNYNIKEINLKEVGTEYMNPKKVTSLELTHKKKEKSNLPMIVLDLDHSFDKNGIKKLKELNAVKETSNGLFVVPELLILSKFKSILPSVGIKNNKKKHKHPKYNKRLIKDCIDISNITHCNEIDYCFLKRLFNEVVKITDWDIYLDFSRKENLFLILENDIPFKESYKDQIEYFEIKYLKNKPNIETFKKILKTIEPNKRKEITR